jgi:pSer/pThr/pTyr-binding forkhead associated (FHA) protein
LDQIEQKYVVGEADRFVGRDSSNDIVLADDQVSVRHVKISFVGGEFRAADLGSSNGTYVNGEQIEGSRDLVDEDLLRIGTTIVRFCGPP